MVGCGTFGVSQVMIGLHRVGIIGLRHVLKAAEDSDLENRDDILRLMLEGLADDNFIPESQVDEYRQALWREVLRHRGENFSEFFSEVSVTVHGAPGETRDAFVKQLESVFADFELRAVFDFAGKFDDGRYPMLMAGDQVIVRGLLDRSSTRLALRKSFSGW